MTTAVTVSTRQVKSKLDKAEQIAGVVYGPVQAPLPVTVNRKEFDKVFKIVGESTVVTLAGLEKPVEVLIKSVYFAPVKGGIQHVDFYAVDAKREVHAHVPLQFVGEAPAAKLGAVINKVMHDVEVSCLAKDLPGHLEVDLSTLLAVDDRLTVADIKLPAGVKVSLDASEVVALAEAVVEEVEVPVAPVDMESIAVEKKGKGETTPATE